MTGFTPAKCLLLCCVPQLELRNNRFVVLISVAERNTRRIRVLVFGALGLYTLFFVSRLIVDLTDKWVELGPDLTQPIYQLSQQLAYF